MDLAYDAQYTAFRDEVRAFLAAHRDKIPKRSGQRPTAEQMAWQKLLISHGYAARTIPTQYGGYGASPDILKSRIIAEVFAEEGAPGSLANQGISMHWEPKPRSNSSSPRP